jgi:peptidoglycan/LPS O-acetylase OafA/YrhL
MKSLKYRSDIDGLRAVAVLGVVIYHAFPWMIPGGFIGVDIFFVISGYLISGILYKGLKANGGDGNFSPFSFREFYARRIRRLFPALITMLVITMAYGWLILLPDEFEQLGKHVAAGTLFIQNIVFWQESGYFDTAASLKPLLHLWSLAVEEQFYIFFPPILLLIWRKKWPLAAIMGVLLVISMVCNLWASDHTGTADFFLTPYRAWEFLGGSILAWWHEERVKKLGGVARGQGILDGKAPASENPPAGFDRAGNTARRGPLSSPEGLGGFSSWPALDQAGQARCGDCHSPPSLAKLENPLQRNPSEFLHTLLDRGHEEEVPAYREVLSWAGLILLVLGMAFIHTGDPYPGWRAILPVAGTLLLMEGGRSAWINRKILSNPAVVWIGLISYPLYLFHWPALSFVHIVKGDSPKPVYLVDALIVALILTVLTYYFIEKKIRHNKSKYTVQTLVGAFILVGALGWGAFEKIVPHRPLSPSVYKMFLSVRDQDMMHGIRWFSPGKYSVSFNKAGGNGPQTLFLGDSNMQQYGSRISKLLAANTGESRGAILVTTGGVLPIKGATDQKGKSSDDLLAKFQEAVSSDPRIDRVVIAARWVAYFTNGGRFRLDGVSLGEKGAQEKAFQELGKSIRELVAKGKKVTVVMNIPTGAELDPKKIYPRTFRGSYRQEKKVLSKEKFLNDHGEVLSTLAKTARENGAEVIDPMDYLCANGICIAEDENGPIRYDEGHLRPGYVREHVKYLDQTVAP